MPQDKPKLEEMTQEQIAGLSEQEADDLLTALSTPDENPTIDEVEPPMIEEPAAEGNGEQQLEEAPAPEEVEPVEEAPAEEPVEDDTPTDPDFNVQESYAKEMELLAKRAEEAARQRDLAAGVHGSELQRLQQKIAQLQSTLQGRQQDVDDQYDTQEPSPAASKRPVMDPDIQELKEYQKQQSIQGAYNEFMSQVRNDFADDVKSSPEFMQNFEKAITPLVQEKYSQYANMLPTMSAAATGRLVRMVLDSAYTDFQLDRIRTARAEALKRKAEQVPKHRQMKGAAKTSGSSSSKGQVPKPKPVSEWTEEEADQWLRRAFNEGPPRRT